LDANWSKLGLTNEQAAAAIGFRAPNVISMWRTGRTPVPLGRVLRIAELMGIDPMVLVILWLEQEETRDPDFPLGISALVRKRVCTRNEQPLLDAARIATTNSDPVWTPSQLQAVITATGA
jgi:hypothetical protein